MNRLFFTVVLLSLCLCLKNGFAEDAKLRSGDKVEIRIGGVPSDEIGQVSGTYTIDEGGDVNMPHIGKVHAAGMTQAQLQSAIESGYKTQQIYTNPSITVLVPDTARFVNVGGAVRTPGRIPYTPDMTVLTAINAAGGFNEFADQKKVRLLRDGQVQMLNIMAVRKDPRLDVSLKPGDTVEVQQSIW